MNLRPLALTLAIVCVACKSKPKVEPNYFGMYIGVVSDSNLSLFRACNGREFLYVEGPGKAVLDNRYSEVRHLPGAGIYVEVKGAVPTDAEAPPSPMYAGRLRVDSVFRASTAAPRSCFPDDQ